MILIEPVPTYQAEQILLSKKRLPILGHALYFLWHWPSSSGTSAVYEIYRRYHRDGILAIHVGTEKMTVVGKRI